MLVAAPCSLAELNLAISFLQLNRRHCDDFFGTCVPNETFSLIARRNSFYVLPYLGICPYLQNDCGYCDVAHWLRDLGSLET